MAITMKFGRADHRDVKTSIETSFFPLEAQLDDSHLKCTIEELGEALAIQLGIENGDIVISGLNYNYHKKVKKAD